MRTPIAPWKCGLFGLVLLGGCQSKPTEPAQKLDPPPAEVPAAPAPGAALRGTRWLLVELAGRPVAAPADSGRRPYLQLLTTTTRAEGNGGCNRFAGDFTLAPATQALRFGPLLSTRMACEEIATESAFMKALESTRRYRLQADSLVLLDSAGTARVAMLQAAK